MATREQIASNFQDLNIVASNAVIDKCLELCINYDIDAEDFCDQWYAFTVSNLNGAPPTIDRLEKLERKEFQKNKSKQKLATPKRTLLTITEDLDADPVIGSYSATTPKSNRIQPKKPEHTTPVSTPKSKTAQSNEIESPSISYSEKYSQRSDSRSVQCFYGPTTANYKRNTDYSIKIENANGEKSLKADARYMYEIMGRKAITMDSISSYLGQSILEHHGLTLSEGMLRDQIGEMTTYGRIVSDSDGKINAQSVLLEGTRETNLCNTSTLNFNKVSKYALFPGQVAVVQGTNLNSSTFIVEKIFTDAALNLPEEPPLMHEPMQLVVAAGPYTLQDNLSYEPLDDLLKYVNEQKPHVLILMGPFLEKTHEHITVGLAQTFDSFFEGLIEKIMSSLLVAETQVIMVSSSKDAHHQPVYPTPPYKIREHYSNLHFVSDPCMIDVNGLVIGATTADILFHISNFELYQSKNPTGPVDRMGRMASHLLNQRCFYPLYPPSKGMCIDHELLEQYGMMNSKPHILIAPSNLRHFIKNINDCLVINPERLTKGFVAGTFARIEINPGSTTSICNRTACQILRV